MSNINDSTLILNGQQVSALSGKYADFGSKLVGGKAKKSSKKSSKKTAKKSTKRKTAKKSCWWNIFKK